MTDFYWLIIIWFALNAQTGYFIGLRKRQLPCSLTLLYCVKEVIDMT